MTITIAVIIIIHFIFILICRLNDDHFHMLDHFLGLTEKPAAQ